MFPASAALTAKNTLQLGQQQLEARVRELEVLLEEVVKESDTALEELRARETDLMQQVCEGPCASPLCPHMLCLYMTVRLIQ